MTTTTTGSLSGIFKHARRFLTSWDQREGHRSLLRSIKSVASPETAQTKEGWEEGEMAGGRVQGIEDRH